MPEVHTVFATALEPGDTWLGEDAEHYITIHRVTRGAERDMIPWTEGKAAMPRKMRPVIIEGTYYKPGWDDFNGTWALQPDQPVEIRRG